MGVAWLAQLLVHGSLDLRVMSLSPVYGCRVYFKKNNYPNGHKEEMISTDS